MFANLTDSFDERVFLPDATIVPYLIRHAPTYAKASTYKVDMVAAVLTSIFRRTYQFEEDNRDMLMLRKEAAHAIGTQFLHIDQLAQYVERQMIDTVRPYSPKPVEYVTTTTTAARTYDICEPGPPLIGHQIWPPRFYNLTKALHELLEGNPPHYKPGATVNFEVIHALVLDNINRTSTRYEDNMDIIITRNIRKGKQIFPAQAIHRGQIRAYLMDHLRTHGEFGTTVRPHRFNEDTDITEAK